jgi:hypothetical protein
MKKGNNDILIPCRRKPLLIYKNATNIRTLNKFDLVNSVFITMTAFLEIK